MTINQCGVKRLRIRLRLDCWLVVSGGSQWRRYWVKLCRFLFDHGPDCEWRLTALGGIERKSCRLPLNRHSGCERRLTVSGY